MAVLSVVGVFLASAAQAGESALEEQYKQHARIVAVGGRALRDALYLLGNQLGIVITYEEPRYEHDSAKRALFPGGPVVPRRRTISFEYARAPKIDKDRVVSDLLREYNQRCKTAQFEVRRAFPNGDTFNVFPVKSMDKDGQLLPYESVLSRDVSVTVTESSYYEAVRQICRSLGGTSDRPLLFQDRPPTQIFRKRALSFGAVGESARSCFNALVLDWSRKEKSKLTWSTASDPEPGPSVIRFRRILPISSDVLMPVSINIESERPLADAVRILEEQFGCAIAYEEPRYQAPYGVICSRGGSPQMLQGGILEFSFSSQQLVEQVLLRCVEAYVDHGNAAAVFAVRRTGNALHVLPVAVRHKDRPYVPWASPLECAISVSARGETVRAVLQRFCRSISEKARNPLSLGEVPQEVLIKRSHSVTVTERSARLSLTRFLHRIDARLSWQILYDPRHGRHVLNVTRVPRQEEMRNRMTAE